jgi:uncharacterized protein YbcV (DUF1398 family)
MSDAIENLKAAQQRGIAGRPKIGGFPYLAETLRRAEAGRSTFPEFLAASWKAGVVKYDVDLIGRTCTYYGVGDEKYVETYPEVEV